MPVGSIAARGSHVPHRRLNRARATFMPDTAWPGPQAPARLIPGKNPGPGSDAIHTLSALQQWFTRVRLPGSHLTHHVRLFAVLTTPAHSPEQPAVVSDLSLHERSRRARLHHQYSTTTSDTIFYIAPSSCVRGARISASFHHDLGDKPSSATTRGRDEEDQLQAHKPKIIPPPARPAPASPAPDAAGNPPRWHRFSTPTRQSRHRLRLDVQSDGTLTEMYKTGKLDGTNALIYRRSDGINVAVTLNRTPREKYCRACPDGTYAGRRARPGLESSKSSRGLV